MEHWEKCRIITNLPGIPYLSSIYIWLSKVFLFMNRTIIRLIFIYDLGAYSEHSQLGMQVWTLVELNFVIYKNKQLLYIY